LVNVRLSQVIKWGHYHAIGKESSQNRRTTHVGATTGVRYDNRFFSIIVLANRRIARRRDYMDSLAPWNALSTID
jgi:ketosteroid isomerase-like protein